MSEVDDDFIKLYEEDSKEQLYLESPQKNNFFSKILNFIAGKKWREIEEDEQSNYSVFEHIKNNTDLNDLTKENHLAVREVIDLSEEGLKIFRQKLEFLNRSKVTSTKMLDMEIFNKLDGKNIEYLKMILSRYQSLSKERNVIDAQIYSFGKNIVILSNLIDDATENVNKIADAEKTYRIFKQDINHLEGEKQELLDEMETLIIGRDFLKNFTFAFVVVSVLLLIGISFLGIFYNQDIFMQIFVLIIIVSIITTIDMYANKLIRNKMRLNIAFQKRAVELLSKKNAVLAYYTNYLNFAYNKYKVNNSTELKQNIKEVKIYQQTYKRSINIRNIIKETETEIYSFLNKNKINKLQMSLLKFAETVNIDDQRRSFESLKQESEKIETVLSELDEKYELITNKLIELSDNDSTRTLVIKEVVETFYNETQKIVLEYS